MAIKANQEDYDITVVVNESCVKRIQVKTALLQNSNTNNSFSGTDKNYDYLVIVIIDESSDPRAFILTKQEADKVRGDAIQLPCSRKLKGIDKFTIRDNLIPYENQWDKISNVNQPMKDE